MKKSRICYSLLFLFVICLGILSRKTSIVPLYFGDLLYAVMMYLLVRIIFITKNALQITVISLLICYSIEFLQLYQAEWIISLRKTLFGRYVLGQGFLYSDLVAYTFGVAITFIIEKMALNYLNQKSE
ncbi:DUF2809 domain-containing protein [Flavobacterium sp. HTF]|uniref:ribosomal maturation YjgA family protein n=1 Tax=Flavobacterium sp. HTF TaxID=2170732 RepID=UPI000D5C7E8F|nr:DUF2809 domain-containing protein [Flavobacterium sp. HTF]PWB25550.1 DUF2809 domain-containing protein [Flavobacterium sp. HTF]